MCLCVLNSFNRYATFLTDEIKSLKAELLKNSNIVVIQAKINKYEAILKLISVGSKLNHLTFLLL